LSGLTGHNRDGIVVDAEAGHILSLPQLQNRLHAQRQWLWSYFTGQRSSRLIPEPPQTPGTEAR
jgi:hypothetical protein